MLEIDNKGEIIRSHSKLFILLFYSHEAGNGGEDPTGFLGPAEGLRGSRSVGKQAGKQILCSPEVLNTLSLRIAWKEHFLSNMLPRSQSAREMMKKAEFGRYRTVGSC